MAKMTRAALRKLIIETLESDLAMAGQAASVSNYLDMKNIDDENDKMKFFGFLSHVLNYEDIDQIAQDEYTYYSFGEVEPKTITKADTATRFYNYPYVKSFRELSDKYGFERVTAALFEYIEQAADMNHSKREDFRMSVGRLSRGVPGAKLEY